MMVKVAEHSLGMRLARARFRTVIASEATIQSHACDSDCFGLTRKGASADAELR
jgi:hypothetical protein